MDKQHCGECAVDLVLRSSVGNHESAQEEDDDWVGQSSEELCVGGGFLGILKKSVVRDEKDSRKITRTAYPRAGLASR